MPLFDHFCCRLAAEPECLSVEETANVALKYPPKAGKAKSSKSDPPLVVAALNGFTLAFWKKKEHRDKNRSPLLSVSLGQVTKRHVLAPSSRRASGHMFFIYIYIFSFYFYPHDNQGASMVEERGEVVLTAFDDTEEKRVEFRCSDTNFVSALSQRIIDASA